MHVCVRSFVAFLIIGAYTDGFSLEAAVPGEKLHLDVLPQYFVEQRLHEERLVHIGGSLQVAQGEAFNVGEEDGPVSEEEASAARARI